MEASVESQHATARRTSRRFGLGFLIALVALVSFAVLYQGFRAQRMRQLTDVVVARGGSVTFHTNLPPDWIVSRLRGFLGPRLADPILSQMSRLNYVIELSLAGHHAAVDDQFLQQLVDNHGFALSTVQRLSLYQSQVSDEGMAALSAMPNLEFLELDDMNITNAGIVHLRELMQLREVTLNRTLIDRGAEADLAALQQLRILDLKDSRVGRSVKGRLRAALPNCEVY